MRLRAPLAALAVALVPAAVLFAAASPSAAASDDNSSPSASPGDAGTRHDPDNRTGLAEWMERCIQGNAKYLARDIPGAIDMYRQAIQLAPKRALPHYLLAEAQLGAGNLAEANVAIGDAEKLSDDRDPNVRGKVLFVMADMLERQKMWDAAKTAWTKYADYCAKHVDAGLAPATPPARIQAVDDMLKQDSAYQAVRDRIANEGKDAGSSK
jgi:tetratricopeptide (TPR) repeat protein